MKVYILANIYQQKKMLEYKNKRCIIC